MGPEIKILMPILLPVMTTHTQCFSLWAGYLQHLDISFQLPWVFRVVETWGGFSAVTSGVGSPIWSFIHTRSLLLKFPNLLFSGISYKIATSSVIEVFRKAARHEAACPTLIHALGSIFYRPKLNTHTGFLLTFSLHTGKAEAYESRHKAARPTTSYSLPFKFLTL